MDAHPPLPSVLRPLMVGMSWPTDALGGLNRYLADLQVALRTAGVEATSVVLGPGTGAPPGVLSAGTPAQSIPRRLLALTFAGEVRRSAAQATLLDSHFALYSLPFVVRLRRLPLVVHFHGPWSEEATASGAPQPQAMAKQLVERAVYRRAKVLVTLSGAFKQLLVERFGVSPWRVEVIPPGVDLDRFAPGDRVAARLRLGLRESGPIVLAARRLVLRAGVDVLVEAWPEIIDGASDALLLITGSGPRRRTLEQRVSELGLADTVRFLEDVSDDALPDVYRAADVSVMPSIALEGFGLSVLESLACGTPVIATEVGGLPEALAGLDRSLVLAPGDPAALAARIHAALSGEVPDGAACRAHAEGFSWPEVVARHLVLYRRATAATPSAALRVVVIDHTARLSGAELALLRTVPALAGVDAHVILGEDGPLVSRLRERGVSCEVLPLDEHARGLPRDQVRPGRLPVASVIATVVYVARLTARLRRLRPDVVHTNSLKSALYGGIAARLARIPVVWQIHDRIDDDYLPGAAVRVIRVLAGRIPAAVITNSAATLRTLGGGIADASAIPVPIDAVGLGAVERPTAPTTGPLRVGVIGRLAPWKGQDLFLQAFATAFPDGKATAMVIGSALFGEDEFAEGLHHLADELGVADRVHFTGFREDIAGVLADLDVLVHTSRIPEPFGQVVVEGMASGLPVIAADAGGPAEIIEAGVTGFLYPPGDVAALAALLRRVHDDPAERLEMGCRARSQAVAYGPHMVAPRIAAVYERVTKRRGPAEGRAGGDGRLGALGSALGGRARASASSSRHRGP